MSSNTKQPLTSGVPERKALEDLRARDDERRRIAIDIHDGLCQELIATSCAAKVLQRLLEKENHPLAAQMSRIAGSVSQAASHARQIAHGLNPVITDSESFVKALRELVSAMVERHHVRCLCDGLASVSISPGVGNHLYRIAQEAIYNAVRHSGATQIDLELSEHTAGIILRVADNGCGLSAEALNGVGFGLQGMGYRASLIHGKLSLRNRKRGGAELICRVPVRAQPPKPADTRRKRQQLVRGDTASA